MQAPKLTKQGLIHLVAAILLGLIAVSLVTPATPPVAIIVVVLLLGIITILKLIENPNFAFTIIGFVVGLVIALAFPEVKLSTMDAVTLGLIIESSLIVFTHV